MAFPKKMDKKMDKKDALKKGKHPMDKDEEKGKEKKEASPDRFKPSSGGKKPQRNKGRR